MARKPNKPELSFLFATHLPDMTSPSVKIHEYIPYGLGVMIWTQTHGRTGLNALPPFFEWWGHKKLFKNVSSLLFSFRLIFAFKKSFCLRCAMRKRAFGQMRTAKAQISLRIRAGWSGPSLAANRIIGYHKMYKWTAKARVVQTTLSIPALDTTIKIVIKTIWQTYILR